MYYYAEPLKCGPAYINEQEKQNGEFQVKGEKGGIFLIVLYFGKIKCYLCGSLGQFRAI